MDYVYPKLSAIDLNITRIGGLGLGNMLFPYARAVLYARDHHLPLIWPTWNSIPAGQILRREKNKRFYNDLFTPKDAAVKDVSGENRLRVITGAEKNWLRMSRKHISEHDLSEQHILEQNILKGDRIIEFSGMEGEFAPLLGKENGTWLYEHLKSILQVKNRKALEFQPGKAVCMHVRLGDFTRMNGSGQTDEQKEKWEEALRSGLPNLSIPLEWYVDLVRQIRKKLGYEIHVYVFSDGTDTELETLLSLSGVERKTFGTAIADIMALAQAKLFIASGSTFSRWVRYLGQMNTITYPGQLGQKLLEKDAGTFETEVVQLSDEILGEIYAQMAE